MQNTKSVVEHSYINKGDMPNNAFKDLMQFALTESGQQILKPLNNQLKAQNYVGIIQTKSGFVLEILPKIHNDETNISKSRNVFIQMLCTIRKLPGYKDIDFANLKTSTLPLFEIFITMFIAEVFDLVKKGIKSDYIAVEDNCTFMKGKLVVGEHVKRNCIHRERFYINYDSYVADIPHNRLIKSTITFLQKISNNFENRRKLKELNFIFDEVPCSKAVKADFDKTSINRTNKYYNKAIGWAKVFLSHKSFSTFSGNHLAFALLFPMEQIFEKYVYDEIRGKLFLNSIGAITGLKYQSPQSFLLMNEKQDLKFKTKPDITFYQGNVFFIVDAKWKLLNESSIDGKYGISQSDLYQLLSYAKVTPHNGNRVELCLVYPKTDAFHNVTTFVYNLNDGAEVKLSIMPFQLPY